MMLTLLTGLLGVFIALDLFLFYVFFEVMLIPMYFIIGIWGGANRLYAAIKFFIYTMAGSLLMLVAIVVMAWRVGSVTGVLSFSYEHLLANAGTAAPPRPGYSRPSLWHSRSRSRCSRFTPGFPMRTSRHPTAGSVLLAGVMLKIGTYGFLRFAVPFFPQVALSPGVTRLMVAARRNRNHLRRPGRDGAARHQEARGVLLGQPPGFRDAGDLGVSVISVQGALMIMISHGLSTGALFLLIGMIYERRHTRADLRLRRHRPGGAAIQPDTDRRGALVDRPARAQRLCGEFLVLLGSFGAYPWATGIATTGVIFAAAYLLWALQRIIFNRLTIRKRATH